MSASITIIATTAMGLESVLAREIKQLGYETVRVLNGKVEFDGQLYDICRSNIWLRTAGRIYVKLGTFTARTFDALFEQTKQLDWQDWIQVRDCFPVTQVTSRKSALFSKSDCQRLVKKAIVEKLRQAHKVQHLEETGATVPVRIQIENDVVTLSIDTSGTGLNKRGYRVSSGPAPLRETLAAGLVLLSRWRPHEDVLMDPFCGSGTILIEAGLIAMNAAPGLYRQFCSQQWKRIPSRNWEEVLNEARSIMNPNASYRIYGSDIDPRALSAARASIQAANLERVFVQKRDVGACQSRFETGVVIANPPYGERLEDEARVDALYREMGLHFQRQFPSWSYYFLTPSETFETLFSLKATRRRKLYNGGLKCCYYQFQRPR